jgi:ABC-type transport system involved in multi-copper enzyme maturation permease subunit
MVSINHRSLFKALIISCLTYTGLFIIVYILNIWADNVIAFLLILGMPIVLFIFALFTLVSGIVSYFVKKDSISLPRLMVYFAIFIPILCIIIWLIQKMTQGFTSS